MRQAEENKLKQREVKVDCVLNLKGRAQGLRGKVQVYFLKAEM